MHRPEARPVSPAGFLLFRSGSSNLPSTLDLIRLGNEPTALAGERSNGHSFSSRCLRTAPN